MYTDIIKLTYRILGKGLPPQQIKIRKPGWGGDAVSPADGAMPQPWHCTPFVEGSTHGFELLYPLDIECRVTFDGEKVHFAGDFSKNPVAGTVWPPFLSTNPGHYSLGGLVDIKVPDQWVLRIEPHPRFFTDTTGNVPAAVIGNLQTSWWPMFFFVTFKSPQLKQEHIFRKGEPYAQVIVVPNHISYALEPMTEDEARTRETSAQKMMKNRTNISTRHWISGDGLAFDDLYKQLSRVYSQSGQEGIERFLEKVSEQNRKVPPDE